MFTVPVTVYLQYKNLSSLVYQAEQQKDIIASAIKKIEGQGKLMMEYSPDDNPSNGLILPHVYWEVKCVSCENISLDNSSIILTSVKKLSKDKGKSADVFFDTVNELGKIYSWKIELQSVTPLLVHSGKNVKITVDSGDGIFIQSFGKSLKNGSQGNIIPVQVKKWFGGGKNLNSTEVIEAKIIAPNEVEYVSKQ